MREFIGIVLLNVVAALFLFIIIVTTDDTEKKDWWNLYKKIFGFMVVIEILIFVIGIIVRICFIH